MSGEIVKASSSPLELKTIDDMKKLASLMAESKLFTDTQSMAQCFVKVLAGKELGIPAFASMTGIHIIKGKPVISANLMATLIKGSGKYRYKKLLHDADKCEIEFFELIQGKWESLGVTSFTMLDAQTAGLGSNSNWQKFPKNMLFARCISNGFREFCPDLALGAPVYSFDELGAEVNENGDAINVEVVKPRTEPDIPEWVPRMMDYAVNELGMSSNTAGDIFKKHNVFKDEKAKGKCWKDIHVTALVNAGVDAFVAESIYKENSKNKDDLKVAVLDTITALNKSGNPDTEGKVTFTAEQVVGNEINPEISAEIDAMIEDGLLGTVPASGNSDDF